MITLSDNPDIFLYTNQGEDPLIDGVDDAEELMATREAMTLLGRQCLHESVFYVTSKEDQSSIEYTVKFMNSLLEA